MSKVIVICVCVIASVSVYSAEPSAESKNQIEHLLTFISTSPCQFMRNGKWYPSADAAEHIRKKYNYILKKGLVNSVEDFIEYSATKSSMSGKTYKVQCGDDKEIESADWLLTELAKYRQQSNKR